ncbi:MAG: SH3 domain-containing protein [Lachnospiraceae bacterium]|nr:SH3 domain-containing protein [Lachnospiraceae bacterium]
MSNRTINRILISIICFLCVAICVLIVLILSRPQQINTQGSTSNTIEEIPASDILSIGTELPQETTTPEESSIATSITAPTEESEHTLYARTTSLLNIRASNNTDAEVLETVSENTILQVLEIQADGWTKILYEDQEAYVSSAYIILIQ